MSTLTKASVYKSQLNTVIKDSEWSPEEIRTNRFALLRALRSGDYHFCKKTMFGGGMNRCTLGVAASVLWPEAFGFVHSADQEWFQPFVEIMGALGVPENSKDKIWQLNDAADSYSPVIEYLEALFNDFPQA